MSSNEDTRKPGSAKGTFVVPPDFDAPLPDEVLADWEREEPQARDDRAD